MDTEKDYECILETAHQAAREVLGIVEQSRKSSQW